MWTSQIILLILLSRNFCEKTKEPPFEILRYEYGNSSDTNTLSMIHKDVIPPFVPLYRINISSNSPLLMKITHLTVEYVSVISKVFIEFDTKTSILEFYIKFPFVKIPYGVVGFSAILDERKDKPPQNFDEEWKKQYVMFRDIMYKFLEANINT